MSKSNIKKESEAKIRKIKNGDADFDASLLKVNVKFKYYVKNDNKRKGFKEIVFRNLPKETYAMYNELFSEVLIPLCKKIKMFDLSVNAILEKDVLHHYENGVKKVYKDKIQYSIHFNVAYKGEHLCWIAPDNKNVKQIYDRHENPSLNDLLISCFDNVSEKFKGKIMFVKSISSINRTVDSRRREIKLKRPMKVPKVFKDTDFYKNANFVMNYIKKHKFLFKFGYHGLTYNLSRNNYYSFFFKDYIGKVHTKFRFPIFQNNMELLKGFEDMELFPFTIEDETEEEILNLYKMLTY